jgi:HD-GYP domain-containing protein (c-di-GMP phosphodiesterase class II)
LPLYSTRLATALQWRSGYHSRINSTFVRLIGISAALHDIGKVGVEDSVLLKPGPLTKTERVLMESHAEIGGKCIRDIELRLGSSNFLQMAREIAISHHERWDGGGYPRALCGEEIPLSARIVAVCDVYDALSTRRVYKAGLAHEKCVEIIREGAGSQFDPEIVHAFQDIQEEFREIALHYVDSAEERPTGGNRFAEEPR